METKQHWSRARRSLRVLAAAFTASAVAVSAETKPVSLDDCVKLALQKNLDIRIAYYNPRASLSQLKQASGAYDPTISMRAQQNYSTSPGQGNALEFIPVGGESWTEAYNMGINGVAPGPTGTRYNLGGRLTRNSNLLFGTNGPIDTGFFYRPSASIDLTQPLLKDFWIDSARLVLAVNKIGLGRSEQAARKQVMTVVANVALAYFDVIASKENVRVQSKAVETSERRLSEQKKRVEVGALAPLEEKRSEAEVYRVKADLILAQGRYGDSITALRNLINDDLGSWDDVLLDPTLTLGAEPYAFDKKDSWHKGLTQSPDIADAQLSLDSQKVRVKFSKNQLFPQLDLVGGYGVIGAANNSGDSFHDIQERTLPNHYAGIQLIFPLGNRTARQAHQQNKLTQEQLLLSYKRIEQNLMRDIDISIRSARTAFERTKAAEKQREFAAQALDAEEKKLANGKSTFFEVLQLQRDLTSAEASAISAKSDYNKELYRLSFSEGDILNKLGILLDIR
jgi:outer membrane protein TolC